jgi:glycosyltransferase, family 30
MNFLYTIGIRIYALGVKAASVRNVKAAKMVAGQKQTLDRLHDVVRPDKKYMWIHAASLGEFEQGRPMIEKLRREHPEWGVILTFFSPSGYDVRCNYGGADVVCYLPFDKPELVKSFLDAAHPAVAVFVKYEFWGNYLHELKRRKIPTYLISAIFRPSQPFFKWWGGMFRNMLRCYTHIFVQDESSKRLLDGIGVGENVTVAGDTRFDRVSDIQRSVVEMPDVERFVGNAKLTFIAGSSWGADEAIYMSWLRKHPEVKVIIAPHEFDDKRINNLCASFGGKSVLLSEIDGCCDAECESAQLLVVDCFGKLSSLYRYADVAYVGGGFGEGIHNVNEAAVYGMPVLFGPKHQKFKEAKDLIACWGAYTFTDSKEFAVVMDRLLSDERMRKKSGEAAGRYIKENIGATDKVMARIFKNL